MTTSLEALYIPVIKPEPMDLPDLPDLPALSEMKRLKEKEKKVEYEPEIPSKAKLPEDFMRDYRPIPSPRPVKRVVLPEISSKVSPIPEPEKKIASVKLSLKQEQVLDILNRIDLDKLQESIDRPKSGYPLKDLRLFAKRLGIPISGLRKGGIAKRIFDKIQPQEEEK
jgi:hypothetical protein